MKLKQIKDTYLGETFFIPSKLDGHYEKHVAKDWMDFIFNKNSEELLDPMTKEEYDKYGDELSKQAIRTSDINSSDRYIGFVEKTGEVVKYDKAAHTMVIYTARPDFQATLSLYKCSNDDSRYRRLLKSNYEREITPDDDYYNK